MRDTRILDPRKPRFKQNQSALESKEVSSVSSYPHSLLMEAKFKIPIRLHTLSLTPRTSQPHKPEAE
jgi:hypothetical protein